MLVISLFKDKILFVKLDVSHIVNNSVLHLSIDVVCFFFENSYLYM